MQQITIPSPDQTYDVLVDSPNGVIVGQDLFGFTLLHAGQSYASNESTPLGRMSFRWSRQFAEWKLVEFSAGIYDWTSGGALGKDVAGRAKAFHERGLLWSLVVNPGSHPVGMPVEQRPSAYAALLRDACARFYVQGLRAIEICNEPEQGSWYGSLGRKPANAFEIRQVARELSPWARIAKQAVPTGVEVWATSSQSMADGMPTTGLAYVFNGTSSHANATFKGAGFLNGHDGAGGIGAQWIDRFTFHGYPSPTHDRTLLPAHFEKVRSWLIGCGYPAMPIVVTEHGVLYINDGKHVNWRDLQPEERIRWVLDGFAVAAAYNARLIFYAWDEGQMGIYSSSWIPEHAELEKKYNALRNTLLGKRIYQLLRRHSDKRLSLRLDPTFGNGALLHLE